MGVIQNFWRSTIGKKIVMAVTGLIGVGFVIGHMVGNLQVFEGAEKINAYGRFLHHTVGTELWLVRLVLLAAVILHVVAAVQLTRLKQAARPQGYRNQKPQVSTTASRTIRWGGFLLLVFIVVHVLHFTVRAFPGYEALDRTGSVDVYANLVTAFRNPLWTLFYVVAMLALALHLYHGVWSSLRTLGQAKASANPLRRPIAIAITAVVFAGFTIVPIAIFLGIVRPEAPSAAVAPAATAGAAPAPTAR